MKRYRRSILPAISIGVLVVLVSGFALSAGLYIARVGLPQPQWSYFQLELGVGEGRIVLGGGHGHVLASATKPPSPGWHLITYCRPRLPSVRRSLWEFDAHSLAMIGVPSYYIIACPIWFATLPFLIAPMLWLRRRRSDERRGFEIESPAAASAAAKP